MTDLEECRRDCLETVRGWSREITGAIESTPLERITRSRIADRSAAPARPILGLKRPCTSSCHHSRCLGACPRDKGVGIAQWCPWSAEGHRAACRWLAPGKPYGKGRITLCGDGSQPMTPNLGQGGCVALEVWDPLC